MTVSFNRRFLVTQIISIHFSTISIKERAVQTFGFKIQPLNTWREVVFIVLGRGLNPH